MCDNCDGLGAQDFAENISHSGVDIYCIVFPLISNSHNGQKYYRQECIVHMKNKHIRTLKKLYITSLTFNMCIPQLFMTNKLAILQLTKRSKIQLAVFGFFS